MSISAKVGSAWQTAYELFVNAGGWKTAKTGHILVGGVWKQFYPEPSGSYTWSTPGVYTTRVPAGIHSITFTVIGGGGGGGSSGEVGNGGSGGGGGSGGKSIGTIAVNPGDTVTIAIGAGGAGGGNNCRECNGGGGVGGASSAKVNAYALSAGGGGGGGAGNYGGGGGGGAGGSPGGLAGGRGVGGGNDRASGGGATGGNNGTGYGIGGGSHPFWDRNWPYGWVGYVGTAGYVSMSW